MNTNQQTPAPSASRHTPEPWAIVAECTNEIGGKYYKVGPADELEVWGEFRSKNRAAHAIDCVNALAGKNPAAVKRVIDALRSIIEDYANTNPVSRETADRIWTEARAALAALNSK